MSVMWKFTMGIAAAGGQRFQMPKGAVFRHCAAQGGAIALWMEIPDPEAAPELRWFCAFATGQPFPAEDLTYLGTCLFDDGAFVLHVYEEAA